MIEQISTAVLIGLVVEMRVAVNSLRKEFENHLEVPPHRKRKIPPGAGAALALTVSCFYYALANGGLL